jgi:catechol 2,3-dioxygenase-like lactoylglutathione lyase family enzyme
MPWRVLRACIAERGSMLRLELFDREVSEPSLQYLRILAVNFNLTKERIHMLDHIILTVSDVERSLKFYTAALKPLKVKMFLPYKGADGHPDLWGFGDGQKAFFWLKQGKPDPASIHWGFIAENNKAVDAFYKAAIAAGAKNNISPRARLEYYPGYYAADVFDPDGYTFEVVHKS